MKTRTLAAAICCGLALSGAATAQTRRCAVAIGNGTSDILISVTVRAEFAPPGSESDRNLPVELGRKLLKDQTAKVEWRCDSPNISYIATGLFANGIKRSSAPFTPRPNLEGKLDTAWIE